MALHYRGQLVTKVLMQADMCVLAGVAVILDAYMFILVVA